MRNLKESDKALRELLAERILVLDGAMGTMLQQRILDGGGFWRGGAGRLQRESGADAAGRGAGHPPKIF